MASPVIEIDSISKRYSIGQKVSYGSLREEITRALTAPFRRGRKSSGTDNGDDMVWALKDISFDVNEGDIVGIIGRNGAGKSTLLKILSRITDPTEGRITMRGRMASLLEVGTGFHPELTGRENIFLNGALLGMRNAEIRRKFDEIVAFSEIEKFLDTPVKRYSSGMYVRLAFAVAAHLEPEILVVDEVLAVGDAAFQKKCLGKMGDVAKGGRTVLFVSHNMSAVRSLCNKGVLLAGGKVVMEGHSQQVVKGYLSNIEDTCKPINEFPPDESKPIKIRRVAIRNHMGAYSESVDLNNKFFIEMDYELRKDLSNVCIGLHIFSEEAGQYIISLTDPELDSSRLDKREKGYYRSEIEIPAKILNTGTYRIRTGVVRLKAIYDVEEDIYFKVIDKVGIVQSVGLERKNSLLSMQLPWRIVRLKKEVGKTIGV